MKEEEPRRTLYMLRYRDPNGDVKRAWYGSKEQALAAARSLNVTFQIIEAVV